MTFDQTVELTYTLAREVLIKNGGRITEKNKTEVLSIKKHTPEVLQNENSRNPGALTAAEFTREEMNRLYKPVLQDIGFEESWHQELFYPWRCTYELGTSAGIDLNKGKSRSGANNAYLVNKRKNWAELSQNRIKIEPDKVYCLSCYIRTSDNFPEGELGIRLPVYEGSTLIEKSIFKASADYTKVEITFQSKNNQIIDIYIGYFGNDEDTWIQIDDFDLVEIK